MLSAPEHFIFKMPRKRNPLQKRHRKKGTKSTAVVARSALALAKKNSQQVEIQHFNVLNTLSGFNKSTTFKIDNIDMTAITPTGYSSRAQYTGTATGCVAYSLFQMDQGTTAQSDGYRSGMELMARSAWIRGELNCSANSNMDVRVMLIKTKGHFDPAALGNVYMAGNTPELYGFIDTGKSGVITKILYNRLIRLRKNDDTSRNQRVYLNIFRKLNVKQFYSDNTIGAGVGLSRRDLTIGTSQYYLVFLTDETTNTLNGTFQLLQNYIP